MAFHRLPLPMRYNFIGRWRSPQAYEYASRRGARRLRAEMKSRLTAGPGPSSLFLPSQTWSSKIFQRQQLAHFVVATIPFLLNPATHARSPVKLFEYMPAVQTVVATPMRENLQCEMLLTADGPEEFAWKLDRAVVALATDTEYGSALQGQAAANTWRARAEAILAALAQARRYPGGQPRRLAPATPTTDPADTSS